MRIERLQHAGTTADAHAGAYRDTDSVADTHTVAEADRYAATADLNAGAADGYSRAAAGVAHQRPVGPADAAGW
jgi:hypothetical protein